MRAVVFICLISIFISCGNEESEKVLPPEKMEAVLFDFIMAEAHTNTKYNVDSVISAQKDNVRLQKKVFAIHGISKAQFEQSFDYYTEHSGAMLKILDSIIAKENRRNVEPVKAL